MSDNRHNNGKRYYHNKKKNNGTPVASDSNRAPHPQFSTCIELEKAIEGKMTEENLVRAVGIAWNKYAWYEEEEEKCEDDSEKYRLACEQTDSWCDEYQKLTEKLKAFLGYANDSTFALPELTALMEKYGFEDTNGIWQRKKQSST